MPTMQFNLSSFTNKNADLKAGNTFSAYAFGDGVANALILAVRLTLSNIRVYSAQCCLDLAKGSGTGRTANFAQNSAIHGQTVTLSEFAHALIQTGAGDVTFTVRASGGSTGNLINLRDNVSGILEIDYFIPQSDFTLDKSELDAGQTITATITPTHPDADHEIIWRFQTAYKDYSSMQSDSASYTTPYAKALTVPLSWLDAIPNTESGLATCTVNTYMNGALTGVVTKQFTIKAGTDTVPSIASLTAARINNGVPSGWDEYVQGISGVQLTANGVNGIYGSAIVEVKTTGAGYTGTSNPYSTGPINAIGDVTFTCTVKDSRGRIKSASVTVTFRAYEPPRFTSIDAVRCNPDGTPNDSGTYVKVTVTYTFASVNGKNGISAMETSRRLYTGGSYTQLSTVIAASGAPYVAGNGFIAASSYVVKVSITDGLFSVDTTDIVPTESWLLHYRVGGRGVAIGMIAQRQDAFEVNPLWEIYYKGMTLDERFGGIDIPSIWPVTSGGTGLGEVTAGSYLKGNGTGALVQMTPTQVRNDIGAMGAYPGVIEFTTSVGAGHGGALDFHFNGSNADYTSRIIEDASGRLRLDAPEGFAFGNNQSLKGLYSTSVYNLARVSSLGNIVIGDYNSNGVYLFSPGPVQRQTSGVNYNIFDSGQIIPAANLAGVVKDAGYIGQITSLASLDSVVTPQEGMFQWMGASDSFFTSGYLYHYKVEVGKYGGSNNSIVQTFTQTYDVGSIRQAIRTYYVVGGWSALKKVLIGSMDGYGDIEYGGRIGKLHGRYSADANAGYISGALEIREKDLVESAQSAIQYAPSIGFHWAGRLGKVMAVGSDGEFKFLNSAGATGYSAIRSALHWIENNSRYVVIGPQNQGYCHYQTDADSGHYFNTTITAAGEIYTKYPSSYRVYHAGNITNGNAGPSGGVDGDIYLQW